MKRAGMLVIALAMPFLLSGCILLAVAAGAGGVVWWKGEASKTYSYGVEKVYKAALAALDDAGVGVSLKSADAVSGLIEGHLADGKEVKIKLSAEGENVTKVKLRIGTMGNKERSQFIFSKIDKRL